MIHGFGRTARLLACLLALAWLAGACGGGAPQVTTGFLSHPERLKADAQEPGIWWWEAPGIDWKRYDKVMLDRVAVRMDARKAEREVSREELRALAAKLREAVALEVSRKYPVVDRPGPGVLRLTAALTNVKPVSPAANVVSTAILMWPLDAGDATVEVRFIDGADGRLIGELAARQQGSTMEVHKVWSRWGQVESAFQKWGVMLRQSLDWAHGR